MNRLVCLLLLIVACLVGTAVVSPPTAFADGCDGSLTSNASSTPAGNGLNVAAQQSSQSNCPQVVSSELPPGSWQTQTVCAFGGAATCQEVAHCADGAVMVNQWYETNGGRILFEGTICPAGVPAPVVDSNAVLRAMRRIGLPPSELAVQPPKGRTLVNFDTNFYTEQGPFTRTVRLLGQRVELKIWPSQFSWVFGDGERLASESAGAPYPNLVITHDYRTKGGVSPRVDTTYAAQFRVNGGSWREVNGTVTIPGNPVQLRVLTASPVLVGYH